MRIVSLPPSATESVCALGARAERVGRSHECDFPAWVESLPAISSPRLDPRAPGRAIHDRSNFNRPGPRIVESLEILLGVLRPELTPNEGAHAP